MRCHGTDTACFSPHSTTAHGIAQPGMTFALQTAAGLALVKPKAYSAAPLYVLKEQAKASRNALFPSPCLHTYVRLMFA